MPIMSLVELGLVSGRDQAQRHPAGIARPAGHEGLDRHLSLPGELTSVARYHDIRAPPR
jgi:hypothetical protein